MAISKLSHLVNIVNGTTAVQKNAEFGTNFINWLYSNWPGTDVLTKTNFTDVILQSTLLLNKPWNGVSATAQAGGSTNTIKLVSTASAVDDFYTEQQITITGGISVGDVRNIIGYVGATKIATVDANFTATPTATSTYKIIDVTWVPAWFKAAWVDANSYRRIFGSLQFTHAASGTDWCIVAYDDGSTSLYGGICIGIRQNSGGQVVYTELTRFSSVTTDTAYLNHAETLALTVCDKVGEYKMLCKDYNAGATLGAIFYNGIIRLDNPNVATDVNAWIFFGMNDTTRQRFGVAFGAEAMGTQIEICADTLIPEGAAFEKNVYTTKIPLGRVWAGSANLGMRGWSSWLAIVPQSYIVSNQMYTIGLDQYYGLGIFDNQIQLPGGGANIGQRVLLKA